MGRSFHICTIAGVPIRVHWLVPVILPIIFLWPAVADRSTETLIYGLIGIGCLLLAVVAHELGHALVAIRLGGQVRDIILWPLGGLTRFRQALPTLHAEVIVSLAGPFANLLLWAAAASAVRFGNVNSPLLHMTAMWNLLLLILNLIPAPPLDGSHALKAALQARLGHSRGSLWAARVGIGAGVFIVMLGFYWGSMIGVFLGIFSISIAARELKANQFVGHGSPGGATGDDVRLWRLPGKDLNAEIRRKHDSDRADREMRERVDELLEKVGRNGYDSLSDKEQAFLQDASRKLRRKGR
jgi:Zn-dependent protease